MRKHRIKLAIATGILAVGTISTCPIFAHTDARAGGCPRENRCVRIDVEVMTEHLGTGSIVRSSSLGTVVAPGLILTHNHNPLLGSAALGGVLVITETSGMSWLASLSDLILQPLDRGTLLIQLPQEVALSAGTQLPMTLDPLVQPGDSLRVAFRRPNTGLIEQGSFQVTQVQAGRILLADPLHLIQPGCSGGGAYLGDLLVGNTWSIDTIKGRAVGSFSVALLPEALPTAVATLSRTHRAGNSAESVEGVIGWAK